MKNKKQKKVLTKDQEFEILKLVLDKFLWLGFGIMVIGMYVMVTGALQPSILNGLAIMIAGAIILVLFMMLLIKEYEFLEWNRR